MLQTKDNQNGEEMSEMQKVKIMNTISEFVSLTSTAKPKIFTKKGVEVTDALKYQQWRESEPKVTQIPQKYGFHLDFDQSAKS